MVMTTESVMGSSETRTEAHTPEEEARHLNMTIKVLKEQVAIFTSRLEPHDTGHIHTTISTLKHRIGELEKERK